MERYVLTDDCIRNFFKTAPFTCTNFHTCCVYTYMLNLLVEVEREVGKKGIGRVGLLFALYQTTNDGLHLA